jgi:phosphohistidine phosphatase
MKTLTLIRHAKSSRDDPALADRDRPLAERGRRDLLTMGRRLLERGARPDLIVSSPAVRTLATAQGIATLLHYPVEHIVVQERLYACQVEDWLHAVQDQGAQADRLILVGHDPELTGLAHRFASEIVHMPTCAVAEFDFELASWAGIGAARPVAVRFDYPKKA